MSARFAFGLRATPLAAALALVFWCKEVQAKPGPCTPSGRWVLATVHSLPSSVDAAGVLDRLTTELGTQDVTLCTEPPRASGEPPAANVAFRAETPAARSVKLEVDARRGAAKKVAQRDVDVSVVPRDSRAAVVALAADELMRAAWDELALQNTKPTAPVAAAPSGEPAPGTPSPDAGEAATPPVARFSDPRLSLGLRGAGEWWSGGLALLGGDAALSMPTWQRVRLELHLGSRTALEEVGPDGTVDAHTFSARVGAVAPLLRRGLSPEISLAARFGAHAVQMSGTPRGTARGSDETAAAFTFEMGPSVAFRFGQGRAMLVLDAGMAAAMQGVDARDGGNVVTGLSGFAFGTSIGIFAGIL